jgi:hypothetical protein
VGYEIPVEREAEPAPAKKEPIVLSVMPERPFPAGHRDLRPLLQRDGLILLSWAIWEDGYGDGSLVRQYIVTWIAAQGKGRRYATAPVLEKELVGAVPERKADRYFYRGLYGNYWDIRGYSKKNTADYVYLAAPFDLDGKTVPGFIRVLKAHGSTVDFGRVFTLGTARKSAAREYLDGLALTQAD